jgi:hypothetical protein
MRVVHITAYLDGGTVAIVTDEGVFCIDRRVNTSTPGKIYEGYPEMNNSNIMADQQKIRDMLHQAVQHPDAELFYKVGVVKALLIGSQ